MENVDQQNLKDTSTQQIVKNLQISRAAVKGLDKWTATRGNCALLSNAMLLWKKAGQTQQHVSALHGPTLAAAASHSQLSVS